MGLVDSGGALVQTLPLTVLYLSLRPSSFPLALTLTLLPAQSQGHVGMRAGWDPGLKSAARGRVWWRSDCTANGPQA